MALFRFRKTQEKNGNSDAVAGKATSVYTNQVYTNQLSADTISSERYQSEDPPVYSEIIERRSVDKDNLTDSSDNDSGWVDNIVYECAPYPLEIEKGSNDGGQTDPPSTPTMEGKPGWVENIIYE